MTEQDKVTVDDIIGIVKTEEQTNSVEEVRKLRGRGNETAKRFTIKRKDLKYAKILENGKDLTGYFFIAQAEFIVELLNELHEENQRLQEENKKLRDFEYFVFKSIGELNEKRGE